MKSNRGSYGCESRAELTVLPLLGTPMSLHAGRVAKLNQANFELLKVKVQHAKLLGGSKEAPPASDFTILKVGKMKQDTDRFRNQD